MTLAELLGRSAYALGRARTAQATGHVVRGAAPNRPPLRDASVRPLRDAAGRQVDPGGRRLRGSVGISWARSVPYRTSLLIGAAFAAVVVLPVSIAQLSGAATSPGATVPAAAAAPAASGLPGTAAASVLPAVTPGVAGLGLTDGIDLFDLAAKTLLVLGLLYLTLRVLRRLQGGGQPRGDGIAVLESRTIAPKTSLLVVSVRGRELVLGLSPAGLVTLADLAPQRFAQSDESGPRDDEHPHPEPGGFTVSRCGLVGGVPARSSTRRFGGRAA